MSGTNETPTREELLRRMWSLAGARVNDAVKLAFLPEEQMGAIGRLDLAALTELKRVSSGTVELKFTDRMRALETLYKLLEQERGGKLKWVSFRSKALGWSRVGSNKIFQYQTSTMPVRGEDPRFYQMFFENRSIIRPSCGNCPYPQPHRCTDVTIADYWGIEKFVPRAYDSRGVSLILVSTPKGERLLKECAGDLMLEQRSAEEALSQQGRLQGPVQLPENRQEFWHILREEGLEKAFSWAFPEKK